MSNSIHSHVNERDKLSADCINARGVNVFKNKADKYHWHRSKCWTLNMPKASLCASHLVVFMNC